MYITHILMLIIIFIVKELVLFMLKINQLRNGVHLLNQKKILRNIIKLYI